MRSPIYCFGGKGQMTNKLIKVIPPHKTYIEVFGGGGSLLFAKEPSLIEVYNDINSDIVNFFRVIRDPFKFKKFYRVVSLVPYSREEYHNSLKYNGNNEIEKAINFFISSRQCFGSIRKSGWSFNKTLSRRGMAGTVSKWLSTVDLLPEISLRLLTVQIENMGFEYILKKYDYENAFFYLDPPYVHATRKGNNVYDYEMSEKDHRQLIKLVLEIKGKVLLSGYDNDIYKILKDSGWNTYCWEETCRNSLRGSGSGKRIEKIWYNYNI